MHPVLALVVGVSGFLRDFPSLGLDSFGRSTNLGV